MKLNEINDLLKKAYASELAEDVSPESEEALAAFEKKHHTTIPSEYRELLKEFGAFNFSTEPNIYTLEELEESYDYFFELYKEYQEGYPDMPENIKPFPIGFFGEGSLAIIDMASSKIYMLIHDCSDDVPLEEVAPDLATLIKEGADGLVSGWGANL